MYGRRLGPLELPVKGLSPRLCWDSYGAWSISTCSTGFLGPFPLCQSLAFAVEVLCSPTWLATPYTFSIHLPRCPGNSTPLEQGHLQGLHFRSGWWMCTFNTICMLRIHLIHQNRSILNPVCSPAESIFVLLCAAGRGKHCQKKLLLRT